MIKIEIVTTANEKLKESGFGSLNSCNNILDSIIKMWYNVKLNIALIENDLYKIVQRKPDLVVLAVKYISCNNGNDIWLSNYFDKYSINYTGSSANILKFDSDKVYAKEYLKNRDIKTADFFTAIPNEYKFVNELPIAFPLFLKPIDSANGNGIDDFSFVTNFVEFNSKVSSLYDTFKLPILVEDYLDGREFTVSIIETTNKELIISPIEIIPLMSTNGLRILGEKAKKDDDEELIEIIDTNIKLELIKLSSKCFKELGVRDYGRIDIKTNKKGEYFFMEANLIPGMNKGSSYFSQAYKINNSLTYDKVVELLISKGLDRISWYINNFRI